MSAPAKVGPNDRPLSPEEGPQAKRAAMSYQPILISPTFMAIYFAQIQAYMQALNTPPFDNKLTGKYLEAFSTQMPEDTALSNYPGVKIQQVTDKRIELFFYEAFFGKVPPLDRITVVWGYHQVNVQKTTFEKEAFDVRVIDVEYTERKKEHVQKMTIVFMCKAYINPEGLGVVGFARSHPKTEVSICKL